MSANTPTPINRSHNNNSQARARSNIGDKKQSDVSVSSDARSRRREYSNAPNTNVNKDNLMRSRSVHTNRSSALPGGGDEEAEESVNKRRPLSVGNKLHAAAAEGITGLSGARARGLARAEKLSEAPPRQQPTESVDGSSVRERSSVGSNYSPNSKGVYKQGGAAVGSVVSTGRGAPPSAVRGSASNNTPNGAASRHSRGLGAGAAPSVVADRVRGRDSESVSSSSHARGVAQRDSVGVGVTPKGAAARPSKLPISKGAAVERMSQAQALDKQAGKRGTPSAAAAARAADVYTRQDGPQRKELGINGFAKLQLAAANNNCGLKIVTYADEGGANGSKNQSAIAAGLEHSSSTCRELRGESSLLFIGNEEVDVISEDQLDRLLMQAKHAKSSM